MANYSQRYNATTQTTTAGAFKFDTISSVDWPVAKLIWGAEGATNYASAADPLPVVAAATDALLTTIDADTGAIATAAASIDTKTPALGQALAAASVPVVLTAAQEAVLTPPAAITGFALESGGNLAAIATDAAAIEALLTTIEGNQLPDGHAVTIDNASIAVTGTFWQATQPVSAATLPLPSGAATAANQLPDGHNVTVSGSVTANIGTVGTLATAAKQDTGNTSLATIAGAVSGTEVQVDIVTMPNVTIAGTVTVGSHAVTNAGTFAVQVDGAALTSLQLLDDSVATTGSAITSKGMAAVGTDGTNARILKTDAAGELQIDVVSSALPTGAATAAAQATLETDVEAAVTALQLLDNVVSSVGSAQNTSVISLGAWDAGDSDTMINLQCSANGELLIATANPVTVANAGTFAVQVSSALPAGTNNIGDVDVLSCALPTGASTLAEQQTQTGHLSNIQDFTETTSTFTSNSADSLALLDDTVYTGIATPRGKYLAIGASDEADSGNMFPLIYHASTGGLQVTIAGSIGNARVTGATSHDFSAAAAEPVAIGGRAFAAAPTDVSADGDAVWAWHLRNGSYVVNQSFAGVLASTGTGASGTGTQRVVTSTDSTIGTVTTVSTLTTLTGGGITHDSADSGNPVKIGARAAATLSDDTMVANGDRTDAVSDLDGAIVMRTGFPLGDLISERVTDTSGTSTAFTNFGATASTRNYVTAIVVYNSSATAGTIDFRDGTGGAVLWTVPIPATGGAVISNGGAPLFRTSANTALAYDVSGALTTVTISISGFKSKV